MLVGGLWHGAGWNFVLWGGVHGLMIAINRYLSDSALSQSRIPRAAGIATTFLCVVLAWVLFRASSLEAAVAMYRSLLGLGGIESVTSISWHAVAHLIASHSLFFACRTHRNSWGL
jgi:alginate O-acetyltransferase complex protein AlgI